MRKSGVPRGTKLENILYKNRHPLGRVTDHARSPQTIMSLYAREKLLGNPCAIVKSIEGYALWVVNLGSTPLGNVMTWVGGTNSGKTLIRPAQCMGG